MVRTQARRRKGAVVVQIQMTLPAETWKVLCRMATTAKHPYPGAVVAWIVEGAIGPLTTGASVRNTQN